VGRSWSRHSELPRLGTAAEGCDRYAWWHVSPLSCVDAVIVAVEVDHKAGVIPKT
jgi:hypothetical protein